MFTGLLTRLLTALFVNVLYRAPVRASIKLIINEPQQNAKGQRMLTSIQGEKQMAPSVRTSLYERT